MYLNIISLNPHNNLVKVIIIILHLYRWGNWGKENLSILPQITYYSLLVLPLPSLTSLSHSSSLPFLKCYAFPVSVFGLRSSSMFPLQVPFELCHQPLCIPKPNTLALISLISFTTKFPPATWAFPPVYATDISN